MGTENTGFHRGFKGGVWEIKGFGFKKCQHDFLKFLLHSKRYEFFILWFVFHAKGCLVVFYALRGCLENFWGYGNSALF